MICGYTPRNIRLLTLFVLCSNGSASPDPSSRIPFSSSVAPVLHSLEAHMRALVRPGLFLTTRLALFQVFVTWILGTTVPFNLEVPGLSALSHTQCIACVPDGWVISRFWPISSPWHTVNNFRLTVCRRDDLSGWQDRLACPDTYGFGTAPYRLEARRSMLGFTWIADRYGEYWFIRHWLIAFVCLLSWGVLKFLYRNRASQTRSFPHDSE